MYSTLSRSFPMLFFVSFFETGCHICEDILVLYWLGQVLLETAIQYYTLYIISSNDYTLIYIEIYFLCL